MRIQRKLLVVIAAIGIAAGPAFAKSTHAKKQARKPANAESSIEVDSEGDVQVDGQKVDIQAGKSVMALMTARIVQALPTGADAIPAFRLQPLELHTRESLEGPTKVSKLNGNVRVVQADTDWMFYENENSIGRGQQLDLQFPMGREALNDLKGKVVVFPVGDEANAEKVSVVWNECTGPFTGNYANGKEYACAKTRSLNDEFAGYLRDHLLTCVNAGMKKAGLAPAKKVHIAHDGTGGDSAHQKTPSLHNAGRAIDIQRMHVSTASGAYVFDFKKTNTNHKLSGTCAPATSDNCEFYEAFRNCWHGLMKSRACPANKNPKRRWIGTLGWEDKKHIAHHLHFSYPFCPKSAGHWTTNFGDDADADDSEGDFQPRNDNEEVEI